MIQVAVQTVTDHDPHIAVASLEFIDNACTAGQYGQHSQLDFSLTAALLQWNSLQPEATVRKFCSSQFCSDI